LVWFYILHLVLHAMVPNFLSPMAFFTYLPDCSYLLDMLPFALQAFPSPPPRPPEFLDISTINKIHSPPPHMGGICPALNTPRYF